MTHSDSAAKPLVIVGCGRIVELGHAPALSVSPDFRVTGVVDPSRARRDAVLALLAGRAAEAAAWPSISSAPIEGSVVLVATPSQVRDELVAELLTAGAGAVLIEKPLGISVDEAESVLRRARGHGTALIPVHNQFCEAAFARVLDMTRSGQLGRVKEVRVAHRMTEPFAGAWPGREDWRTQASLGCLLDLGYQALCLVLAAAGQEMSSARGSARRSARGSARRSAPSPARRSARSGEAVEAISTAELSLDHRSGAHSEVFVSWESESSSHRFQVIGEYGEAMGGNDGIVVSRIHGQLSYEALPAGLDVMFGEWYRQASAKLDNGVSYDEAERAVNIIDMLSRVSREMTVMEFSQVGGTHGDGA